MTKASMIFLLSGIVCLGGCSGCHGSEIDGQQDSGEDTAPADLAEGVDPVEETDGPDVPDLSDPFDVADTPWDPDFTEPFPDPGPPDPWVPDFWDVPFDYMDIPADYTPDPAGCGNGTLDSGEECDDGNTNDNDACTNRCLFPRCGDGSVWFAMEDCDPPGTIRPCTTSCGSVGGEWCEAFCRWTGACIPPVETCGNGVDDDCDGNADVIHRITGNVPFSHLPPEPASHLTWTGSRFTVLWGTAPDILVASHLDEWGRKIDWDVESPGVELGNVFWTGSLYGIFYTESFRALYPSGSPASSEVYIVDAFQGMAVAWSGSEYGVVAQPYSTTDDHEMLMYAVAEDGSSVAETAALWTWRDMVAHYRALGMAWTGSVYALLYHRQDTVTWTEENFFQYLRPDGAVVDTILLEETSPHGEYDFMGPLIWTGSQFITMWSSDEVQFNDSSGMLLSSATSLVPFDVSVWTGSGFGAMWEDDTSGVAEIYFADLDGSVSVRGGIARMTRTPPWSVSNDSTTVAWTGSSYGLAWRGSDGYDLRVFFAHIAPCP